MRKIWQCNHNSDSEDKTFVDDSMDNKNNRYKRLVASKDTVLKSCESTSRIEAY